MSSLFLFLLLASHSIVEASSSGNHMAIDRIECFCNAPICVNLSCSLVKFESFMYGISYRAVIIQPVPKITLQIRKYQMTPKKEWKISNINVNIDYCEFAKGANNPVLSIFVPGLREQAGHLIRPCPYEGELEVKNYTFEMGKNAVLSQKGAKRRIDVKFLDSKRKPIIGFTLYNNVI